VTKTEDVGTPMDIGSLSFEECFSELEQLVSRFEQGQMALGESIARFERGMLLVKRCNELLSDAEKKVSELLQKVNPGSNGSNA